MAQTWSDALALHQRTSQQVSADLSEALARAGRVAAVGKISGAVGTFANVDPQVEDYVAEKMGLTPAELQLVENATLSDADICRAMGVPPWLIGIKEGAKLGDSGQSASADERIYWMNLRRELEFLKFMERQQALKGKKAMPWPSSAMAFRPSAMSVS